MNRIKQLREETHTSQKDLATLLNLKVAGISKLETGRVPLKDIYIIKLANYFNTSTDYLLGISNNQNLKKLNNTYMKEVFEYKQLDTKIELLNLIDKNTNIIPEINNLIKNYLQLNKIGRKKILDNIHDLLSINKYIKNFNK